MAPGRGATAAAACTACFLLLIVLLLGRRCAFRLPTSAFVPPPAGLAPWADRSLEVFGVLVAAAPRVDPRTLLHAAAVLAEFLDQDQDGFADVPEVSWQLQEHQAVVLLLADEDEYLTGAGAVEGLESEVIKNDNPGWNCSVRGVFVFSELFQTETRRKDGEDAAWEEILHLITHVGYGCAFPERWGFQQISEKGIRSELSRALDIALGSCPPSYTGRQGRKERDCHYFYEGGRSCSPSLEHEYSHCTQELLRLHDPEGFRLAGLLPQGLPRGLYRPAHSIWGDLDDLCPF
ncbi:Psma1 [Symbiodinium natans]|uniref:Psma1 protein n=1 Tax=Symbiodinium natans TaxID=878477 RepID=A0A812PRJ1_9DINO|nr:Psma1 [Symbiodinium natans]